ncbi:MAG TPA: hypothetical protein VIB60_06150 [Methylomirabilota bacterium]|jgi:hypothetical protein
MRTPAVGTLVILAMVGQLLGPGDALAYIDLGTGSYVFQVIIASLLGAAFAVKAYWERIRAFFGRRRREDDDPKA